MDFEGDYTLTKGFSTREVYRTALGLFDSALTLIGEGLRDTASGTYRSLAQVGRGRTLLALGVYDSAAQAVAAVPTEYRYGVSAASGLAGFANNDPGTGDNPPSGFQYVPGVPGVGEREGQNGLDYLTSGDPRAGGTPLDGEGLYGGTYYFPAKYDPFAQMVELVLADGIEARLIEAEAALQGGDPGAWLVKLNALRTDGTYAVNPDDAADTLWHAGTGGVDSLKPLADPGTAEARVDLMFRERAFWLYLTAHRQGDLRRLIREYPGRTPEQVYPTGPYNTTTAYGNTVVIPVPEAERKLNPQYGGCLSLGA